MKNEFDTLFQKEMDRKAFLRHVGVGLMALTGITTVIKALNGLSTGTTKKHTHGYSSSVYGGKA